MSLIQTQQVRFSYDAETVDAREVLHGVDLSIEEGEFVALLGHNALREIHHGQAVSNDADPHCGKSAGRRH